MVALHAGCAQVVTALHLLVAALQNGGDVGEGAESLLQVCHEALCCCCARSADLLCTSIFNTCYGHIAVAIEALISAMRVWRLQRADCAHEPAAAS